ncbi:hypothetical protein Oweho_1104 [Owenweeksia hongkongensis DSM 17368]|uniref:Uncharacterized protein n=1 Tax=Owenweeksia hongkongensis (strain DSM 17368 / CIP 108786 / JCM 12287 / NRRL B-23963 / UST20020801) TaxID=926562 RepID=G8R4M1_OWEHD|nr:hypothetical protein [Owenweeksia hongkongensis]AEV32110.1 hypothetical protein Oweho_1104 [Owenweeksia hongkongensis DSM 17368]
MNLIQLLEFLVGLFFTLGIGVQLRYEGIRKIHHGIAPLTSILFFMGTGSLVVLGISYFNLLLTIAASLGFIMSVFLVKGAINSHKKIR